MFKQYDYKAFPTPDMLAEAQVEYQKFYYSKSKKNNENDKINNVESPPPVQPPRCKKAQIFKLDDYFHIDKRAKLVIFLCSFSKLI